MAEHDFPSLDASARSVIGRQRVAQDVASNRLNGECAGGGSFDQPLEKHTAGDLAEDIRAYLLEGGVDQQFVADKASQAGHGLSG